MRPVPIPTKDKSILHKAWIVFTHTREWELEEDWWFWCKARNQYLFVEKGFIFNGASIPKIFRWFVGPTGLFLLGSLPHDKIFQDGYIRVAPYWLGSTQTITDWTRANADKLFRQVNDQANESFVVNFIGWLALAAGSWMFWRWK